MILKLISLPHKPKCDIQLRVAQARDPYLHAALRALAGNLFLESGVRGGDSYAGRELARAMSKPLACDPYLHAALRALAGTNLFFTIC